MLGGLLIMLKMTNLTIGAGLSVNGVYIFNASALSHMTIAYEVDLRCLCKMISLVQAHSRSCSEQRLAAFAISWPKTWLQCVVVSSCGACE